MAKDVCASRRACVRLNVFDYIEEEVIVKQSCEIRQQTERKPFQLSSCAHADAHTPPVLS